MVLWNLPVEHQICPHHPSLLLSEADHVPSHLSLLSVAVPTVLFAPDHGRQYYLAAGLALSLLQAERQVSDDRLRFRQRGLAAL